MKDNRFGRTFFTRKESTIATIPVGYDDGYNRLLSSKGEVLIRGRRVPVVGRVSMNLITLDVSEVPGVEEGDDVDEQAPGQARLNMALSKRVKVRSM